jgi:hypothetical protein
MATLRELETALVNAHKAGDADAARKIAVILKAAREDKSLMIPGAENVEIPGTVPPRPSPTLAEQAIGTGESALTLGTGMAGTIAGTVGGAVSGAVQTLRGGPVDIPGKAQEIATAMTYQPRTEAGQQQLQAAGEFMQSAKLDALGPMVQFGRAAEMAPAVAAQGQAMARAAVPAAVQRVQQAAAPIQRAAQSVRESVVERVPGFGAGQSVGAAETPAATIRRERAESMPVPFTGESGLTKGMLTREHGQQEFERTVAKRAEEGAPIRERMSNITQNVYANLSHVAEAFEPGKTADRAIGMAIDRPLRNRMMVEKRKINQAYQAADEAGEMDQPIATDALANRLNEFVSRQGTAPNITDIRREALRLGVVGEDEAGNIVPGTPTFRDTETLRQFIGQQTKWEDGPQSFAGAALKGAVDEAQSVVDTPLLMRARQLRTQYGREFDNTGLTKMLLSNKKGTTERKVAVEDVFKRVMYSASLDEMNKFRATLLKSGDEGKKAWNTIKARTIEEIADAGMTRNRDTNDQRTISQSAINKKIEEFDADGRLDSIFGKRQAQMLRDLGQIAADAFDAPPGTTNPSGTANAVLTAMDTFATFMTTGVPAPAITAARAAAKYAKTAEVRNRVREALQPTQQSTGKF